MSTKIPRDLYTYFWNFVDGQIRQSMRDYYENKFNALNACKIELFLHYQWHHQYKKSQRVNKLINRCCSCCWSLFEMPCKPFCQYFDCTLSIREVQGVWGPIESRPLTLRQSFSCGTSSSAVRRWRTAVGGYFVNGVNNCCTGFPSF